MSLSEPWQQRHPPADTELVRLRIAAQKWAEDYGQARRDVERLRGENLELRAELEALRRERHD